MHKILKFFDYFEDRVRGFLSHYPMLYAIIGGFAVVIFWRAVWEVADQLKLSPFWSLVGSVLVMMATGLFVSFFIGDRIILSGLKHEKKITEKTEDEVKQEETILVNLALRLERIEKDIKEVKEKLEKK
jgi:hypothetical protein